MSTAQTHDPLPKIRVVLVNEFPIFSEALGLAIEQEDDLEYVGSAITAEEAVAIVTEQNADVAVIDVDMPSGTERNVDGIDLARTVKTARPETRVLILSAHMDLEVMARAANEGACGFLSKTSTLKQICLAVRTAKDGGIYVEGELIVPLLQSVHATARRAISGSDRAQLTGRELEVLTLLGEGLDAGVIAKQLGITLNTCRGHVKNVLVKLGCHSQLEAVVEAMRQGLLPHLSH